MWPPVSLHNGSCAASGHYVILLTLSGHYCAPRCKKNRSPNAKVSCFVFKWMCLELNICVDHWFCAMAFSTLVHACIIADERESKVKKWRSFVHCLQALQWSVLTTHAMYINVMYIVCTTYMSCKWTCCCTQAHQGSVRSSWQACPLPTTLSPRCSRRWITGT